TLVLLNGRRLESTYAGFFDLSNIPLSAVERIEVTPVGSSAIYGSDALAGAVNIVLKKDIEGMNVNASYGAASNTSEGSLNADWGKRWDRGSFTVVGSYSDRGALLGSERLATTIG